MNMICVMPIIGRRGLHEANHICWRIEALPKASALGVFPSLPNRAIAESFSLGTSPVDWPGFSLDPETVSVVLRNREVPGRPQHRGSECLKCLKEHNSLVGDVRRTVDVQPVKRSDKLSKREFLVPEHRQTDIVHSGHPQRHCTEGLQCLKEQRAIDVQPVKVCCIKACTN